LPVSSKQTMLLFDSRQHTSIALAKERGSL
jgi:hypothetical protein